jgi:hypothetical protein
MPEKKVVNMRPPYVKSNTVMKPAHENPRIEAANGYRHDDALQPVSVKRKIANPPAYVLWTMK